MNKIEEKLKLSEYARPLKSYERKYSYVTYIKGTFACPRNGVAPSRMGVTRDKLIVPEVADMGNCQVEILYDPVEDYIVSRRYGVEG